jgi:hypothetical protein
MEYKKSPDLATRKELCDQTRGRSHKPGRETQARMRSNIQANLGGWRGESERVAWRRGRRPLIRGVPDQGLRLVDSRGGSQPGVFAGQRLPVIALGP